MKRDGFGHPFSSFLETSILSLVSKFPGRTPSTITGSEAQGTSPVEGFRIDLREIWSSYEI